MGRVGALYERCFIQSVNRIVLLFLQSSVELVSGKYPHMTNDYPLNSADGRRKLEHAIVDTVREPLVVLDGELRVITASRSFYLAFKVTPDQVEGRLLYELGGGEWNIPAPARCLRRSFRSIPRWKNTRSSTISRRDRCALRRSRSCACGGEVVGRLRAAVQHDHQRDRLAVTIAAGMYSLYARVPARSL
jgi:hypothetical protein